MPYEIVNRDLKNGEIIDNPAPSEEIEFCVRDKVSQKIIECFQNENEAKSCMVDLEEREEEDGGGSPPPPGGGKGGGGKHRII